LLARAWPGLPLGPLGDLVVHVAQASGIVPFVIDVNGCFG
jgi:hypothetical protein